jgi:hypothetical protein
MVIDIIWLVAELGYKVFPRRIIFIHLYFNITFCTKLLFFEMVIFNHNFTNCCLNWPMERSENALYFRCLQVSVSNAVIYCDSYPTSFFLPVLADEATVYCSTSLTLSVAVHCQTWLMKNRAQLGPFR